MRLLRVIKLIGINWDFAVCFFEVIHTRLCQKFQLSIQGALVVLGNGGDFV